MQAASPALLRGPTIRRKLAGLVRTPNHSQRTSMLDQNTVPTWLAAGDVRIPSATVLRGAGDCLSKTPPCSAAMCSDRWFSCGWKVKSASPSSCNAGSQTYKQPSLVSYGIQHTQHSVNSPAGKPHPPCAAALVPSWCCAASAPAPSADAEACRPHASAALDVSTTTKTGEHKAMQQAQQAFAVCEG